MRASLSECPRRGPFREAFHIQHLRQIVPRQSLCSASGIASGHSWAQGAHSDTIRTAQPSTGTLNSMFDTPAYFFSVFTLILHFDPSNLDFILAAHADKCVPLAPCLAWQAGILQSSRCTFKTAWMLRSHGIGAAGLSIVFANLNSQSLPRPSHSGHTCSEAQLCQPAP